MKFAAALLATSAAAVDLSDGYRNARLLIEDGHLADYNAGKGVDKLRFLDIDFGRNQYLKDLKGDGFGYGPQIAQFGDVAKIVDVLDDEFRYRDYYTDDAHSYSDLDSRGDDVSDSKHTSDSDFTDFSNGTFSNKGYHGRHGGPIKFDSDIDIYTSSDDFELNGFEDGPDGHSNGYGTDNYTDSTSSDGYTNGEEPDGHFGHGHFGRGTHHWHSEAYNGHDYGNPDLFLNGGLFKGGHAGQYGYTDEDQPWYHTYDAWRPVHNTYTGLSHWTKPNFQYYDSTARFNLVK